MKNTTMRFKALKVALCVTLFALSAPLFGQSYYLQRYNEADSLIMNHKIQIGLQKLITLEKEMKQTNLFYDDVLIYIVKILSNYEYRLRMNEQFEAALNYANEALNYIAKGSEKYSKEYNERHAYMMKNKLLNFSGMQMTDSVRAYRQWFYDMKQSNALPEGLAECYNFDFFKVDTLNIWGYEWYESLPKDRMQTSFSKVVYYVYSSNPDGSDKEQLYRFHVLMFHGDNAEFDYVLSKRLDAAKSEPAGTYYNYTYKENIDYQKLHNDVKQLIKSKERPSVNIR